jgi:hypothetical protein
MDIFPRLSEITELSVPKTNSFLVYLLYSCAFLWLLIPYLKERKLSFGLNLNYLNTTNPSEVSDGFVF